jgi:hypothetical protein
MDTVRRAHRELRKDGLAAGEPLDEGRVLLPDPAAGPDELAARRQLARTAAASGVPGLADAVADDMTGARERVVELLLWALQRRVLDSADVAVISDHYRPDAPHDDVAAQRAGVRPASLRQRRSRAVRRLAGAAGRWAEHVA